MKRLLLAAVLLATPLAAAPFDYPLIYVAVPRSPTVRPVLPEVHDPGTIDPGADLMLRQPDGTISTLYDCPSSGPLACSALDPKPSLDAEAVCFSIIHRPAERAQGTNRIPRYGASLLWLDVSSGVVQVLIDAATVGYDLAHPADPTPNYAPMFTGCQPLPDGRIMFTSNRSGHIPVGRAFTIPSMHIWVRHADGELEEVLPMSLCSALHPELMSDGWINFSSCETQGFRDERAWGVWRMLPDGRQWQPLLSAFERETAFHFQAETPGFLVAVAYYNFNNDAHGSLRAIPYPPLTPQFYSRDGSPLATRIVQTRVSGGINSVRTFTKPFQTIGEVSWTPWTHGEDSASPCPPPYPNNDSCNAATRVGKVTTPAGAPGNRLLLSYTRGPANSLMRPTNQPWYDDDICEAPAGPTASPAEYTCLTDPSINALQPRALVPFADIYGATPPTHPWLPRDPRLPKGSAYGITGTTSVCHHEGDPGAARPNNSPLGGMTMVPWFQQGGTNRPDYPPFGPTAGTLLRLIGFEPMLATEQRLPHPVNERTRILGDYPAQPDCSVLALVAADTPFTFQRVNAAGSADIVAQTWHQVRPGEVRADCDGCHRHSGKGGTLPDWKLTQAALAPLPALQAATTVDFDDVKAIIRQHSTFAGMSDTALYAALVVPITGPPSQTLSQYVRGYDSGHSSLIGMLAPTATPAELNLVRKWVDLAAPRGGAQWDRDTARPAVNVEPEPGGVYYGAADGYSGIASISARVDGVERHGDAVAGELGTFYLLLPAGGALELFAIDGQGNRSRTIKAIVPPQSTSAATPTASCHWVGDISTSEIRLDKVCP